MVIKQSRLTKKCGFCGKGFRQARYRQLLELDSIGLEITPDGAREIASEALRLGTGARGLDQVLERLLFPFRFDPDPFAGRTVVVDRDLIAKALGKTG